eukprot:10923911-Alexandrium_andersonii.AAC.1
MCIRDRQSPSGRPRVGTPPTPRLRSWARRISETDWPPRSAVLRWPGGGSWPIRAPTRGTCPGAGGASPPPSGPT